MTDFKVHCSIFFTLQSLTTSKQQQQQHFSANFFPFYQFNRMAVLVQFIRRCNACFGALHSHRTHIMDTNIHTYTSIYTHKQAGRQAGTYMFVYTAVRSQNFPYSLNCAVPCPYIKQMLMVDNSTFHYRRSIEKQG